MSQARPVTRNECLRIAGEIEETFDRYGVTISPGSDVNRFVKETRWLAERMEEPLELLGEQDRGRFIRAFVRLEQARHIGFIFRRLQGTQIPRDKVKALKKRLDRLSQKDDSSETQDDSRASDTFFELEIGGRLARYHPAYTVTFEEPDIVVDWPDGRVGLACKRPKSVKRVQEHLSKAIKQGTKAGFPFFVIVCAEEMVVRRTSKDEQPLLYRGAVYRKTLSQLEAYYKGCFNSLASECSAIISSKFSSNGPGGVLLCSRFVGLVGDQDNLSIQWTPMYCKPFPNPKIPDAEKALTALVGIMGQPL